MANQRERAVGELVELPCHVPGAKCLLNSTPKHFLLQRREGGEVEVVPGDRVVLRAGDRLVMLAPMHTAPWLPTLHGTHATGWILRLLDEACLAFYCHRGLIRDAVHLHELLVQRGRRDVTQDHVDGLLRMMAELGLIAAIPESSVPLNSHQVGHA